VIARQLLAAEHALAATLQTRDRAAMEQLLDDAFVLRSEPDVGRVTWIENAVTHCWGDRFEITQFKADAHDDVGVSVGVATFELTLHVNPVNCQPATVRSLITDVWINRDGAWRLRVRHSGPVPAAANIASQYGLVPQLPPAWKVDGELSFVGTGGNASTQTLGLSSALVHQANGATSRVAMSFVTTDADHVTRARAIDAQARHGVNVSNGLDVFGRLAFARDRFAGIAGRGVIESGLSYTASDTPEQTLTLEGSAGFTAENRLASQNLRFAVATGTLGYERKLTPGTDVQNTLSMSADVMSAHDWRMSNALTFQATLNRLLSIKLSQYVEYRNFPVPGFGRVDTKTSAALVFSFRSLPPPVRRQ
jgi:putative salt-induced outer membrane protein YdiY